MTGKPNVLLLDHSNSYQITHNTINITDYKKMQIFLIKYLCIKKITLILLPFPKKHVMTNG
jgi:hypothetical protein